MLQVQKPKNFARQIIQKYSTLANKKIQNAIKKGQKKRLRRQKILQPRILIVDGTNMYLRRFSIHQYGSNKNRQLTNRNGQQTGAVYTMVLMLNKLRRDLKASHCFICWQGYNSKQKRSQINQDYKADRVYKKSSSFVPQLKRVQAYIGNLPMTQMKVDYAEADDVISLLVRQFPTHQKIIVSNDRDFVQLVNDSTRTKLYLPNKKWLLDQKRVIQKFECKPQNFIYKKVIIGDDSDNIKGIDKVGPKTLQKNIGYNLINQNISSLDQLIQKRKGEFQKKLNDNKKLLQDNIQIMSLEQNTKLLSLNRLQNFKSQVDKPVCFNNAQIRIMMRHDGIYGQTIQQVVRQMYILQYLKKKWTLQRIGQ